jgi:dTDP-4-dehydrorhamnose reductase
LIEEKRNDKVVLINSILFSILVHFVKQSSLKRRSVYQDLIELKVLSECFIDLKSFIRRFYSDLFTKEKDADLMIHIVGGSGVIGLHLKQRLQGREKLFVQEKGNWDFSSILKDDFVFYLRSVSSPFKVMSDPEGSREINVIKTKKAISDMLSVGARIVFASSDVVYGDTKNSIVDEETPINPHGEYAIQKASVEEDFRNERNFLSLRISSVVGEGSNLRELLRNQEVVEIFDPVIRTPIHVNDLGALCCKLLNKDFRENFPNGVLNAGGRTCLSNFEVAVLEAKYLGVNRPVVSQRTAEDEACRPATVCMATKKAQEFANLSFDLAEHYE